MKLHDNLRAVRLQYSIGTKARHDFVLLLRDVAIVLAVLAWWTFQPPFKASGKFHHVVMLGGHRLADYWDTNRTGYRYNPPAGVIVTFCYGHWVTVDLRPAWKGQFPLLARNVTNEFPWLALSPDEQRKTDANRNDGSE